VLDKNPEIILDDNLEYIQSEFKKNIPNLILSSNSFHKIEFLNKIISSTKNPIIFVDMDFYIQDILNQKLFNIKRI